MNWPPIVTGAIADAIGRIDAQGVIVPENAAMATLLAAASVHSMGDLAAAMLDADELADLEHGTPVCIEVAAAQWRLRRLEDATGVWLVASDVSGDQLAAALTASQARASLLVRMAASLVHDLSNHLGSGIGLADHMRRFVADPADVRLLDELAIGSRQGMSLLRALASQLVGSRPRREWVDLRLLLNDCLAVVDKSLRLHGVTMQVESPPSALPVRTVAAQAVQAMLEGLTCLIDHRPAGVEVMAGRTECAIAGGRRRPCTRVVFTARGLAPESVLRFAAAAASPNLVDATATRLRGVFAMQSRLGGELQVRAAGSEVSLDYWLPAATLS